MTKYKQKDSFIIHHDTASIFQELTNEQAGELIKYLIQYVYYNNDNKNEYTQLIKLIAHHFIGDIDKYYKSLKINENHWNWQGGITSENHVIRTSDKIKEWRKSVFNRDKYLCQLCKNKKGNSLHAHHIKPFAKYPEYRFDINNGVTLCKKCHNFVHSKNNTKKEFL